MKIRRQIVLPPIPPFKNKQKSLEKDMERKKEEKK
jgi:hypothetical protein